MLDGMSDSIQGSRIENLHSREVDRHSPTGLIFLLCICVVSCPYVIYYPTVVARCGLFVLIVPLNPKQTIIGDEIPVHCAVVNGDGAVGRFCGPRLLQSGDVYTAHVSESTVSAMFTVYDSVN